MSVHGIMLTDDLIFFSRVSGTARAGGLTVKQAKTPESLLDLASHDAPHGVILDLHNERLDLNRLLAQLREACPAMPRVIAYGSHVEAETLRAARVAGCDQVFPRSRFVEELPANLEGWLS